MEDGATSVGLLTDFALTFSAPMETWSVESAFSMTSDGAEVAGTWQWTTDDFGVFRPSSPLAFGATCTVTLEASAKDLYGVPLAGVPCFFSFTTIAEPAGWPTPGQPPSGALISVTLSHGLDQLPDGRYVTNHPFDIQVTAPGATHVALLGADSYDVQGMTLLDVTFDADGGYAMLVSAWNDAGDYGEGAVTVVWDTTPPNIRITKIADPVITDPEDLLSPPFGFLWLNDDADNVARNVYNARNFNVEFTADDLPADVFFTSYGFYNIGAHHDAIAVPYGNDMARDYEYPYPKDNDIIRLGHIAQPDPFGPPEMLPLEAAPGTGAVLSAPEAWCWYSGPGEPIGGGKFRVGAQVFSDLVDLGLCETQLLLLQATDTARNTRWAYMVFAADLWEDQFHALPRWSYSHFPRLVCLPYDVRWAAIGFDGGPALHRLSYNYIEEEINYSLWQLPAGVEPIMEWIDWNNNWEIGEVVMEDFAGNFRWQDLEVPWEYWMFPRKPTTLWHAIEIEQAYYMLPAGERARCRAGFDPKQRVFAIGPGHGKYEYTDDYGEDRAFKFFGYAVKASPPLWLLPRRGEPLKPRLDGVGLVFSEVPPDAAIRVTPYLKTIKAAEAEITGNTAYLADWQSSYYDFRWLQHAGWSELTLSFNGTARLPGEVEDTGVTGTTFHAKEVNLVRVVPSVAATGCTAALRIRAADLGPEGSSANVCFQKGDPPAHDPTIRVLPGTTPTVVCDDPLNTDIVQAIEVAIEIADENGFDGYPAGHPDDTDGSFTDDQLLGLRHIVIKTDWVHAYMPGLPGPPSPSDPPPLQPYAGPGDGVMLPEVLEVKRIEPRIVDIRSRPNNRLALNDFYVSQSGTVEVFKDWLVNYRGMVVPSYISGGEYRWERRPHAGGQWTTFVDNATLDEKYSESTAGDFDVRLTLKMGDVEYYSATRRVAVAEIFSTYLRLHQGGPYQKSDPLHPDAVTLPPMGIEFTGYVLVDYPETFKKLKQGFIQSLNEGSSTDGTVTFEKIKNWELWTMPGEKAYYEEWLRWRWTAGKDYNDSDYGHYLYDAAAPEDLGKVILASDTPGIEAPFDSIAFNDAGVITATATYVMTGHYVEKLSFTVWVVALNEETEQYVPVQQQDWSLDIDNSDSGPWWCEPGTKVAPPSRRPTDNKTSTRALDEPTSRGPVGLKIKGQKDGQ